MQRSDVAGGIAWQFCGNSGSCLAIITKDGNHTYMNFFFDLVADRRFVAAVLSRARVHSMHVRGAEMAIGDRLDQDWPTLPRPGLVLVAVGIFW